MTNHTTFENEIAKRLFARYTLYLAGVACVLALLALGHRASRLAQGLHVTTPDMPEIVTATDLPFPEDAELLMAKRYTTANRSCLAAKISIPNSEIESLTAGVPDITEVAHGDDYRRQGEPLTVQTEIPGFDIERIRRFRQLYAERIVERDLEKLTLIITPGPHDRSVIYLEWVRDD